MIKHQRFERIWACQAHLALRLAMAFDKVSGAHGGAPIRCRRKQQQAALCRVFCAGLLARPGTCGSCKSSDLSSFSPFEQDRTAAVFFVWRCVSEVTFHLAASCRLEAFSNPSNRLKLS